MTQPIPSAFEEDQSPEMNTHQHAQYTVTRQWRPGQQPPDPWVPPHLLHGVFAHSVRTFSEGGNWLIDFSYQAPLSWTTGDDPEWSFEHIVVARVLMPEEDFLAWVGKMATALGYSKAGE
jgi:hypothetical protein